MFLLRKLPGMVWPFALLCRDLGLSDDQNVVGCQVEVKVAAPNLHTQRGPDTLGNH
jgi:hypothetical protein